MKLIKQSYSIIDQTKFDIISIKKQIERCSRVCYKSEDKITDDSYKRMVNMLIEHGHDRPLEFGTIHLRISEGVWNDMVLTLATNYHYSTNWIQANLHFREYFITTNYRYYLFLIKIYPEIEKYFTEEDNELFPKRHTVHFVLSRGIMDEFRTHVGFSHIAESTRWINYNRGKFGNEITCIIPYYCLDLIKGNSYDLSICKYDLTQSENLSEKSAKWVKSMCQAEQDYMDLINDGCIAQQARDVLPLGVKSELISCGFEDAWENFIRRRSPKYGDSGAHPMAAEIANKLGEEFIKRGYIDETKISCRRHPC